MIPTRDRWEFVQRALRVALGQRDVDLEVLVVIDGGADESALRLAELDEPRLRVIELERNVGVSRARNEGAARARARWLGFLDDDDLWAPDRTRRLLDAATESDVLVAGGMVRISDTEPPLQTYPPPGPSLLAELFWHNVVGGPSNALVSRQAFASVGGYDPSFEVLADWDLWIRLLDGNSATTVAEPLNGYVIHEAGMHRVKTLLAAKEFERLHLRHAHLAQRLGIPFNDAHFVRWLGDTHRRAGRRGMALRLYGRNIRRHRAAGDVRRALSVLAGSRLRRLAARRAGAVPASAPSWVDRWVGEAFTAKDGPFGQ